MVCSDFFCDLTNKASLKSAEPSHELATEVRQWRYTPLSQRDRGGWICEFKATLSYLRLKLSKRETELTQSP